MRLVKQPKRSSLCGQCCVAMLTGVDLEYAEFVFGKRSKTTWNDVIAALYKLGVKNIQCGRSMKFEDGYRYLVKIVFPHRRDGHYLVYFNKLWYDPSVGKCRKFPFKNGKITSYLRIKDETNREDSGLLRRAYTGMHGIMGKSH